MPALAPKWVTAFPSALSQAKKSAQGSTSKPPSTGSASLGLDEEAKTVAIKLAEAGKALSVINEYLDVSRGVASVALELAGYLILALVRRFGFASVMCSWSYLHGHSSVAFGHFSSSITLPEHGQSLRRY